MDNLDLSSLTVLVVDDQVGMRRVIVNIFRDLGMRKIFEAGTGKDALRICKEDKPEIIFTDSAMSPMSGEQLTRMILRVIPFPASIFMILHSVALSSLKILFVIWWIMVNI